MAVTPNQPLPPDRGPCCVSEAFSSKGGRNGSSFSQVCAGIFASTIVLPTQIHGQSKDKKDNDVVIGGVATKFIKVPKGTFWMGWSNHEWIAKTPRQSKQVEIKQDFEMAACRIQEAEQAGVM